MVKAFKYALLARNFSDDQEIQELQKLFAYLENSDRPDYNPSQFCLAFKDN